MPIPQHDESVDFLHWWCAPGPWVLTAIDPDSPEIETRTFEKGQEEALLDWLAEQGETRNIYFHVNPVVRPLSSKAKKTDVASMVALHVDVDPRAGEDLEIEQARALDLLRRAAVPPSCIVFSGGGYQGFWRLEVPIPIDGQEDLATQAERYNMQLEIEFGGDHCHNVDRIMRLPGTVNHPNKRKRARGRKAALARVVERHDDRIYPLDRFTPAQEVQSAGPGFGADTVRVSGNIRRLASVDELPASIGPAGRSVITTGQDPDRPDRWSSRSEALFWVCCELVRVGCSDETIFSVITDPGFAISESVLEKGGRSERYALRQIERAREYSINPQLQELNDMYAVVGNVGGKCRVLLEVEEVIGGHRRSRIDYQSFSDFENWLGNRNMWISGKKGDPVPVPLGKWWLENEGRRQYERVIFAPGGDIPGCYNLWKGFAFDARPGDCSLYLDHVRENICGDDTVVYEYLLNWMATAVQRPDEPGHIAVVLQGRQGTGKGVFANVFGALFGRHYLPVRDSIHLFGQFNGHLRDCVVLFADEAFWAGSKKQEGLLKSMITEPTIMSEAKYLNPTPSPNCLHIIMASNEAWVVPAGADDRRFLVLNVGEGRIKDIQHFTNLHAQMENGGHEALLYLLKTRDLSGFNVQDVPQTDGHREQKIHSLTPEEEWWFAKLEAGKIFDQDEEWPSRVFASHLCYDYTTYCRSWGAGSRSNSTRLGRFMRTVCPSDGSLKVQLSGKHDVVQIDGAHQSVSRPVAYVLPSLQTCRDWWDKRFFDGKPYDWPTLDEIEEKEEVPF